MHFTNNPKNDIIRASSARLLLRVIKCLRITYFVQFIFISGLFLKINTRFEKLLYRFNFKLVGICIMYMNIFEQRWSTKSVFKINI